MSGPEHAVEPDAQTNERDDQTGSSDAPDAVVERQQGSIGKLLAVALVAAFAVATGNGAVLTVVIVLLAMITIHEAGHFVAAKLCRIGAPEFFVGFGPTVWSFRRGATVYGLKALPLGGYVKIAGMGGDVDTPGGYSTAPRWKRAAVIAAGPGANIATALVASMVLLTVVGLPGAATTELAHVVAGSPAAGAGLQPGDRIVAVNGQTTDVFAVIVDAIATSTGSLSFDVERDGTTFTVAVRPEQSSGTARIGVVAAQPVETVSVLAAFPRTVSIVSDLTVNSARGLAAAVGGFDDMARGVFGGTVAPEQRALSPVGAVQVGVEVGGRGLGDALSLVIAYSVFLAVFNLLPIPPLDGGHLAINAFEASASRVARRNVTADPAVVGRITVAFISVLLVVGLMALILDITQPILGS